MRLVLLAWMLVLAVPTMGTTAAPSAPDATLPAPITTRQTLFSIPFQIDRVENPMREAVEVQLHVSTDQGVNWQLYSRVKPEQSHFLFRAVTDGEYWFAIGTLDRSGQLRPDRAAGPGLRVVVDTTLPELELDARQGAAGQVILNWQVSEPYLDLDTLRIYYRCEQGSPWQPVAIDRQSISSSGTTSRGEVIWWPESRSRVVEIRAEVADQAGNTAVSHAQVKLDLVASADDRPGTRPTRDAEINLTATARPPASEWRASVDSSPPLWQGYASNAPPAPQDSIASGQGPDAQLSADPDWYEHTRSSAFDVAAYKPPARRQKSSLTAEVNPAVGNPYLMPQHEANDNRRAALPDDVRPQMVNSRLFELEYRIDSLGPSGVRRVQLWGTRDGGRTWTSFGSDHDKQSPILVTVPGEGIYGFRVAVENRLGTGGEKPQSGDPPDVWIGVDLTKPVARILAAEREAGDPAGRVIIRWEADDQMLTPRPVSLFYSDTLGGPWLEIASGLENTGSYAWSVGRRAPERIYLRLEVRDEAGNVGVVETTEAVALDPLRPAGRIRSVRPLVGPVETSPSRYRSR